MFLNLYFFINEVHLCNYSNMNPYFFCSSKLAWVIHCVYIISHHHKGCCLAEVVPGPGSNGRNYIRASKLWPFIYSSNLPPTGICVTSFTFFFHDLMFTWILAIQKPLDFLICDLVLSWATDTLPVWNIFVASALWPKSHHKFFL